MELVSLLMHRDITHTYTYIHMIVSVPSRTELFGVCLCLVLYCVVL